MVRKSATTKASARQTARKAPVKKATPKEEAVTKNVKKHLAQKPVHKETNTGEISKKLTLQYI